MATGLVVGQRFPWQSGDRDTDLALLGRIASVASNRALACRIMARHVLRHRLMVTGDTAGPGRGRTDPVAGALLRDVGERGALHTGLHRALSLVDCERLVGVAVAERGLLDQRTVSRLRDREQARAWAVRMRARVA